MNNKTIIYLIFITAVAAVLVFTGCATKPEEEPGPKVTIDMPETVYISPQTSETVNDVLEADVTVSLGESEYVKGFMFKVTRWDGVVVHTITKESDREEVPAFPDEDFGLVVPETLRWFGENEQDQPVIDGEYTYNLLVWNYDDFGYKSENHTVIVDNTPPEVTVDLPYKVFSPNDDGNKDMLIIKQEGSKENRWEAEIQNAEGEVVREYTWQSEEPENISWSGKDETGEVVPDGTYSYVITSADRAGNSTREIVRDITVDTTDTPVVLEKESGAFSPDGDGTKDTLELIVDAAVYTSVDEWELLITDEDGDVVRTVRGTDTLPETVTIKGVNDEEETLPDGVYSARMDVVYENGNDPKGETGTFRIDTTDPEAEVSANYDIFSPNGDGNKESITIRQEATEEPRWTGRIIARDDTVVREYTWKGKPESSFKWRGTDDEGDLVEDGTYQYVLEATDRAGNTGTSNTVSFELDTSEIPELALKPNLLYFSPNDDGTKDRLQLDTSVETTEGIVSYTLTIENSAGEAVKTISEEQEPPSSFSWDGTNDEGESAPNGEYRARFKVTYKNGNVPVMETEPFVLDRSEPNISADAEYKLFSPNGDGNKDSVTIRQSSSKEDKWSGEITNEEGETVFTTHWDGRVKDFTWDGTNNEGNTVEDGEYTYAVYTTDKAGNTGRDEIENITVDTESTPIDISAADPGFSPNNDGKREELELELFVDVQEGIQSWEVAIKDRESEQTVKTYGTRSGGEIRDTLVWNGRNDDDERVDDGWYYATFSAVYKKGNRPDARTESSFALDTDPPKVEASISPKPFSPDGDGYRDTANITFSVEDENAIQKWRIRILDPGDNLFKRFDGDKAVTEKTITWNGRSDEDELVQPAQRYTVKVRAVDRYGNAADTTETLPVDVFVEEEDGKLKIKITSIHFEPDTADYRDLEEDKVEQNLRTLDRLAEILARYDDYEIRIEGHAVQLYWWDEQRAEEEQQETLIPLSKDRAEAVKEALVERGIEAERITTKGIGGVDPVVPHGDEENRWKNRRVEFILTERDGES